MKQIGLIGGTSWISTIEYYRLLNQSVEKKLGGYHCANILLYSIDYHEIKSNYHGNWDIITKVLYNEIERFLSYKPDCLILCNNTLHKAFDIIRPKLNLPIPFFHAVELTAKYAADKRYKKLLLLGTKFTMEDGFYAKKMEDYGLDVEIPDVAERVMIQAIQNELADGNILQEHKDYFKNLLAKYNHFDAVILACTELPLAITQDMASLTVVNPMEIQCDAAIQYALDNLC